MQLCQATNSRLSTFWTWWSSVIGLVDEERVYFRPNREQHDAGIPFSADVGVLLGKSFLDLSLRQHFDIQRRLVVCVNTALPLVTSDPSCFAQHLLHLPNHRQVPSVCVDSRAWTLLEPIHVWCNLMDGMKREGTGSSFSPIKFLIIENLRMGMSILLLLFVCTHRGSSACSQASRPG